MKEKVFNAGIFLSSLIAYPEWGQDQHQFIFQMEGEVLF